MIIKIFYRLLIACTVVLTIVSVTRSPVLRAEFASSDDSGAEEFVEHLREGYARSLDGIEPQFMRLRIPFRLCVVHGKLNPVAERTLNAFERLVVDLADTGIEMVEVPSVGDCPDATFMFVRVHDGGLSVDTYRDWAHEVFARSGLIPTNEMSLHSWGGAQLMWSADDDVIYLVTASQIAPSLPDDGVAGVFVKTVLVQELFQAMTFGDDLEGRDRFDSILHEIDVPLPSVRDRTDGAPEYSTSAMQRYTAVNATGLCYLDLMVIALIEGLISDEVEGDVNELIPMMAIPMANVEAYAREHYAKIDAMARRISEGGQYADILDDSCS